MSNTKVSNIVNSTLNQDACNIIYNPHNSVFDLIIKSLDYRFVEDKKSNYAPWYNLWMSNDPIFFSQNYLEESSDMHIHSLLLFHNPVPSQFKKEDSLILKKHVKNSYKILCSQSLASSWLPSDNKWITVEYGIPYIPNDDNENRDKIVIFNFNNNDNITAIYNNIRSKIDNVTMITNMPKSLESLYSILYKTKITIDFENPINSLCSAMCGCFCVSSYDINDLFYYKKLVSLNNITDELLQLLNTTIDINHIKTQQDQLNDKFSFDIFAKRITSIISSITKEKYIL